MKFISRSLLALALLGAPASVDAQQGQVQQREALRETGAVQQQQNGFRPMARTRIRRASGTARITVQGERRRIRRLRFSTQGATIRLQRARVRLGNGEVINVPLNVAVAPGRRTRAYSLPVAGNTGGRFVSSVEIDYDAGRLPSGRNVSVVLEGRAPRGVARSQQVSNTARDVRADVSDRTTTMSTAALPRAQERARPRTGQRSTTTATRPGTTSMVRAGTAVRQAAAPSARVVSPRAQVGTVTPRTNTNTSVTTADRIRVTQPSTSARAGTVRAGTTTRAGASAATTRVGTPTLQTGATRPGVRVGGTAAATTRVGSPTLRAGGTQASAGAVRVGETRVVQQARPRDGWVPAASVRTNLSAGDTVTLNPDQLTPSLRFRVTGQTVRFDRVVLVFDNNQTRTVRPGTVSAGRTSRTIDLGSSRGLRHARIVYASGNRPGSTVTIEFVDPSSQM